MYRTCLFCSGDLGTNEVVASFPVGRRLAFDPARGRLWVVCGRCTRWNLTPIEERWEAIERCDSLYAGTPRRASTDNIGLARLPHGLELIRIGEARRPEFAAWRYGRIFARRRRRMWMTVAGVTGAGIAVMAGAGALAATVGAGGGIFIVADLPGWIVALRRRQKVVARVSLPDGEAVLRGKHVQHTVLLDATPSACTIRVRHGRGETTITGDAGTRVLGRVLASVNRDGATDQDVSTAVRELESRGGSERFLHDTAQGASERSGDPPIRLVDGSRVYAAAIGAWGLESRLALEMALHESTERAALEGELRTLEAAWRDAEEIAGIADDLLLPPAVTDSLRRLRVD